MQKHDKQRQERQKKMPWDTKGKELLGNLKLMTSFITLRLCFSSLLLLPVKDSVFSSSIASQSCRINQK
jgi:hypothetical protein